MPRLNRYIIIATLTIFDGRVWVSNKKTGILNRWETTLYSVDTFTEKQAERRIIKLNQVPANGRHTFQMIKVS